MTVDGIDQASFRFKTSNFWACAMCWILCMVFSHLSSPESSKLTDALKCIEVMTRRWCWVKIRLNPADYQEPLNTQFPFTTRNFRLSEKQNTVMTQTTIYAFPFHSFLWSTQGSQSLMSISTGVFSRTRIFFRGGGGRGSELPSIQPPPSLGKQYNPCYHKR